VGEAAIAARNERVIAVLEIERGEDGIWNAEIDDVRQSGDIETFPTLDGLSEEQAPVRFAGSVHTLTIYRRNDLAFVRLDALSA
jgi:hypothetical protein